MSRGMKCRCVCSEPVNTYFAPEKYNSEKIIISVEELETLRLADMEGLEQAQAAERMEISRGTFQRILYSARYKVADALTQGKAIAIQGGNYRLLGKRCQKGQCENCRFPEEHRI